MWYADTYQMELEEGIRQSNLNQIERFETQFSDISFSDLQSQKEHVRTDDNCRHYIHKETGTVYSWNYSEKTWKTNLFTNEDAIKKLFG